MCRAYVLFTRIFWCCVIKTTMTLPRFEPVHATMTCPTLPTKLNKGWWASTGLGKTPRSRYRGGFAPPNPPVVVVLIWILFEFIWIYLNSFEFIWIYLNLFDFIWNYLNLFEFICFYLNLFEFIDVIQWIYWCNGNVIENRYAIRHTRCAILDTRYATRERRFKWIFILGMSNQNRTN